MSTPTAITEYFQTKEELQKLTKNSSDTDDLKTVATCAIAAIEQEHNPAAAVRILRQLLQMIELHRPELDGFLQEQTARERDFEELLRLRRENTELKLELARHHGDNETVAAAKKRLREMDRYETAYMAASISDLDPDGQ